MKNLMFSLAFMLIVSFAFANTKEYLNNEKNEKLVSECCIVTVSDESTGESATVRSCATTASEACDRAYARAKLAVSQE